MDSETYRGSIVRFLEGINENTDVLVEFIEKNFPNNNDHSSEISDLTEYIDKKYGNNITTLESEIYHLKDEISKLSEEMKVLKDIKLSSQEELTKDIDVKPQVKRGRNKK